MVTRTDRRNIEVLQAAPRVDLGQWPTPVEYLERGIWVKRDDLSGLGRGGAKARKIAVEYHVKDMKGKTWWKGDFAAQATRWNRSERGHGFA